MSEMSDEQFGKEIAKLIDKRIYALVPKIIIQQQNLIVGKVVTSGSGTTISVYINNATTAVDVKNPRSLSLTAGQLVAIIFPNGRNDNEKYVDRVL